jgi:intracellular multiplication protein IcmK
MGIKMKINIIKKNIIAAVFSTMMVTTVFAADGNFSNQVSSQNKAISELISKTSNSASAPIILSSSQASSTKASQSSIAAVNPKTSLLGSSVDSQAAFASTVHNMMPFSPKQIVSLHAMFNATRKAAATEPGTPPKPTSTSVMVSLAPGSAPPVVRLQQGYVSSLVFLDSTGQPWPIQAYDVGDPSGFSVQFEKSIPSSLFIQALGAYKPGNLVVVLKGQKTPVMITLMPGQTAVDYRVDMRVPGLGPNASPTLSALPDTSNPQLLNVLDGVPPVGAKTLQVQGGVAQAWLVKDKLYLRTRMTLLSPSWVSTMNSPDGTHAYQLIKSPVLLASDRGKMTQLTLKGL